MPRPGLGTAKLAGIAALWLAATTTVLVLFWPDPAAGVPPPPPRLRIAGQLLDVRPDAVANAVDRVRRYARAGVSLRLPDGGARPLVLSELGAEIDRARLAELVRSALDSTSPLARAHARRHGSDESPVFDLPVPIKVSPERATSALVAIKDELDRPASDAFVDLEKRQLRPEKSGFRLDVHGTIARLDAGLRDGKTEIDAVVDIVLPRVLAAQLGNVRFDRVLGYFETPYSQAEKQRTRTYNLRLAASKLDGTVLLPGEVFDFNARVGPRDEANGFKVAMVIAEGELVDGIGGGTCQISGTLHAAVFFAGLTLVERWPHSRPSSYIKLGLDAAVAYPTMSFRFKNDFDFPIVLHETVKGGVVRAEILGPQRKRTVSFFRHVDEVEPFEELVRDTDELARGERVLSQRGVPGFKTTVVRVVRDGAYAWRTKIRNHYPATMQIVKAGTGATDAKLASKGDSTLEDRADEQLVMTQGPDIRTPGTPGPEPGGGMVEARIPGPFGTAGWQKALGMKVFEDSKDDEDAAESPDGATRPDAAGDAMKKDSSKDEAAKKALAKKSTNKKSAAKSSPARKSPAEKGAR